MKVLRSTIIIGLLSVLSLVSRFSMGQEISATLSETAFPSVPYLVEPVLPESAIRLQTHLLPTSMEGGNSIMYFPFRLIGSFAFSERVIGEASMPFFALFPDEGDAAFEVGNPRIGMEAPILLAGGRTHRWTFSLDLFLPVAQIGEPENQEEENDAILRASRYASMSGALPTMSPDFAAESLPIVVGTHYRLRLQQFIAEAGIDFPFLIGFNFGGDPIFSDGQILTRYGTMFGYDAHPFYPTIELAGVTKLSGEGDSWTVLLGNAGFRYAIRGFEPGVAVTIPIIQQDDAMEFTAYASLELVYRFR